jgi:peptidoglycan/xylan/chitin deacetylase (PgdA/CDA1 family)
MNFVTTSLHRIYNAVQRRYPDVLFHGNTSRRAIALTLDDGPHPHDTPRVLDVLEKHNVRATFFLVGQSIEQHPNIVKQIHQRGHQLGLHCYRHVPFPLENPNVLRTQLERTRNVIANICGVLPETIKDLRPPYGAFNTRTRSHLPEWGYRLVMWSCIPPHWMQPIDWSIHQVIDAIAPGAVIVLHDGHGHGTRVAEIVDALIPRVRSLGFEFVTVEEMQNQREQLAA